MSAHARVVAALRTLRQPLVTEETDLHDVVARCLRRAGIPFVREASLGPADRVDFLADGGVGIECKKGRPNATRLAAQLARYGGHDRVRWMVVVLPWKRHVPQDPAVEGKPVSYVGLNELWGVAV